MKTARRLAKNPVFAFLLTGVTLFASCTKQAPSNPASPEIEVELTGEEMFREIMLLDGENVDSRIPAYTEGVETIAALTDEQDQMRVEFINEIVSSIDNHDPQYFAHFKSVMTSGDPYSIEKEMVNASRIIQVSLMENETYGEYISQAKVIAEETQNNYDFSKSEDVDAFASNIEEQLLEENHELSQRTIVALAAVVVVAVVVWEAAAIVNVAAVATVAAWTLAVVESIDIKDRDDLRRDDIIKSVASGYSPKPTKSSTTLTRVPSSTRG